MDYILKRLDKNDIDQLISLSKSVKWDYNRSEIETILKCGILFGHKNNSGELISSAAVIPYQKLASIGMVIVDQRYRGKGLGKMVTKACVETVPVDMPVMLIATDEGKAMYERLGFRTVGFVSKLLCKNYIPADRMISDKYRLLPIKENDLLQITKLDQVAFGSDRSHFLRIRIKQSSNNVVLRESDGRITGYGISIQTPQNLILGPIVAPNNRLAYTIINQLAKGHHGTLRIDVPLENQKFNSILEQHGFQKVNQPPMMLYNATKLPQRNNQLYGIAAQIFG